MVYVLGCNRGSRFFSADIPVYVQRGGVVRICPASQLKVGDRIAWERQKFVSKHREFFLQRLEKRDPRLKAWILEYESIGHYNREFRNCYDKIQRKTEADVLDQISERMRNGKANASNSSTLGSWMSSDCPWLPLEQADLGILARALKSLAKRYGASGTARSVKRLEIMSTDDRLRDVVGWIRGKYRTMGRSVASGKRFFPRGGHGGKSRGKPGGSQTRSYYDPIDESRRKALADYEKWLSKLPTGTRFDWAVVKKPLYLRRGHGGDSESNLEGYRSFVDGPVKAGGRRQHRIFKNLLRLDSKRMRGTSRRKKPEAVDARNKARTFARPFDNSDLRPHEAGLRGDSTRTIMGAEGFKAPSDEGIPGEVITPQSPSMDWKDIRALVCQSKSDFHLEFERFNPSEGTSQDNKTDILRDGDIPDTLSDWAVSGPLPTVESPTETLAWYAPRSSPNTITYDVAKIADQADALLMQAIRVSSPSPVSVALGQSSLLFRACFAEFVRFHETFHYLAERAARLISDMDDAYRSYHKSVYEPREKSAKGNLEEALADAFAASMLKTTFPNQFDELKSSIFPHRVTSERKRYLEFVSELVSHSFLSSNRPPGYREAREFVVETERLIHPEATIEVAELVAMPRLTSVAEDVIENMKGFTWLFDELSTAKQVEFDAYSNRDPIRPFSYRSFVSFLDNFRGGPDSWFRGLLPRPQERTVAVPP